MGVIANWAETRLRDRNAELRQRGLSPRCGTETSLATSGSSNGYSHRSHAS